MPRKNAKPGKIILTRGLRRLLDLLAAWAILKDYLDQHGELPPQVAAFLPDDFWGRTNDLSGICLLRAWAYPVFILSLTTCSCTRLLVAGVTYNPQASYY